MITKFLTFTVKQCCSCGVSYALSDDFIAQRQDDHKTFYCPNGHSLHYAGENTEERLSRELKSTQARLASTREELAHQRELKQKEERRVRAYRGVVGRYKRRVGNGVCPCCNRTFKQLAAHMEKKHPHFAAAQPQKVGGE